MDETESRPEVTALMAAAEALARTFPAFDELEHIGGFNDSLEEIFEAPNEWELLVALLRAWPPELFGQLLERAGRDARVATALERIDEESAIALLSNVATTPTELLARLR